MDAVPGKSSGKWPKIGRSGKHPVPMRNRIIQSLFSLVASTGVGQAANTISQFVLAALLLPQKFGYIGISTTIITTFIVARNAFILQTLIHRADRVRESANQMIVMAIAWGLFVCGLLFVFADTVTRFFHAYGAVTLLHLMGIAFFIECVGTVPDTLFAKELRFRKKMWLDLAKPVILAGLSILLVVLGFGADSVGWGMIAGNTVWTVGLYWLSDYRPRPSWDPKLLGELLRYGQHVLAGTFMVFLFTNLDNASVGRILGPKALGFYAFAFLVGYFPAKVFTDGIVAMILLPVFAKLQGKRDEQASAFIAGMRYVTFYAAPICIATILLVPAALASIYGPKWEAKGWGAVYLPIQILSFYGLAHSYFLVVRNLCNGVGRARNFWLISGLQLLVVLPLLSYAPLHWGGIVGTSLIFTTGKVLATGVGIVYVAIFTRIKPTRFIRPLIVPTLAAIWAGVPVFLLQRSDLFSGKHVHWYMIAAEGAVFAVVYLAACYIVDPMIFREAVSLTKQRGKKKGAAPQPAAATAAQTQSQPTAQPQPALALANGRPRVPSTKRSGAIRMYQPLDDDITADDTMVLWRASLWAAYQDGQPLGSTDTPNDQSTPVATEPAHQ